MKFTNFILMLLRSMMAPAQLAITVLPLNVTGQKAIVPLGMKNNFAEKGESARAIVFLLDEHSESTKWVIGGTKDKPGLATNKEVPFNVVNRSHAL